jgi:hypothetical protein
MLRDLSSFSAASSSSRAASHSFRVPVLWSVIASFLVCVNWLAGAIAILTATIEASR